MLVRYLLIIIYKGGRGPNTKGPGKFTWEIHGFLLDFAMHTSHDLGCQQPVSVRQAQRTSHNRLSQSTPTTFSISR